MKIPIFIKYLYNLSETGYSFESALALELRRCLKGSRSSQMKVIDFGCGEKPFGYLFKGKDIGWIYYGIDVYPGKKVDILYDGREVPIGDSTIDVIVSTSVLEHIADVEKVFSEICRILKPDGIFLAVVPFINHIHGVPFDYQRLTCFGWEHLVNKVFGDGMRCHIRPVDGRINCLVNMITGQINFGILDIARFVRDLLFGKRGKEKLLHGGGASPESRKDLEMRTAYAVLKINPINFFLGILAWGLSRFPVGRRVEGEITSGYLMIVRKLDSRCRGNGTV